MDCSQNDSLATTFWKILHSIWFDSRTLTPHGIRHNIEINGLHWRLYNEIVVVALLKDDGIMCRGLVVATSEWPNSRQLMSNEVLFQRHKGIPVPPPNLNARFLEVKDIFACRGMSQELDLTPELKHLLSKCTWSSTIPGSVIEYYV